MLKFRYCIYFYIIKNIEIFVLTYSLVHVDNIFWRKKNTLSYPQCLMPNFYIAVLVSYCIGMSCFLYFSTDFDGFPFPVGFVERMTTIEYELN